MTMTSRCNVFGGSMRRRFLLGVGLLAGLLAGGRADADMLFMSVDPTPAAATVTPGDTNITTYANIKITTTDQGPYTFLYWRLDGGCSNALPGNPSYTTNSRTMFIKVTDTSSPAFVTAVYSPNVFSLTVNSSPTNGGTTFPSGTTNYLRGTTVNVSENPSATPAPGYEFLGWSGAAYTPLFSNSVSVLMDSDKILTANFIKLWSVTQYKYSGPSAAMPYSFNLRDGTFTNIANPNVTAEQSGNQRYRCNGWTNGTGSVLPPTQLGAAFTSFSLNPVTTNSSLWWNWMQQFFVTVSTNPTGYVTFQELSPDNNPGDSWVDSGSSILVTVTPNDPAKYEPDYVTVNGVRFDLSASYQTTVTITNPVLLVPYFRVSSQDDPGFVAYMTRYGLKAGSPGQHTYDDPDQDGLSNIQEYQLSNTNKSWYYSPINSDSDNDGMDDLYETDSVDSTNIADSAKAGYRPAATDPGSGSVDKGPQGNPDQDYHWSTTDGYMQRGQPLMNIEEYRGPDTIAPYTKVAVNFGDPGYPFGSNPVGYRPTVYVRTAVPGDTGDQSKGNTADSDTDVFDDGFEYSWDQWQHWGRTNVASLIGGTEEIILVGVTNGTGFYLTNTIPDWTTARVFNPGTTDSVDAGPDNDILYDYQTGKVSPYYFSASREYSVWKPDALSPDVATAPHSIRMDSPPTGDAAPRRCSHPFMWDVDLDGLPDGYEVVFGYDPWANRTSGHLLPDGLDNPDDDWMARMGTNALALRNHEVYVATNYDCRTAWARFYPTPETMPGQGSALTPYTERYGNLDEMFGPDGMMCLHPVVPGGTDDDATNPIKVDSDGDGIWDGWENYVGLNPSESVDAAPDADNDTLSALAEFQSFVTSSTNRMALLPVADWNNKIFPTDPNDADTDGDKLADGDEKPLFNSAIAAMATNLVLDATGNIATQIVVVGTWAGRCYTDGGLNPTSSDTDGDTMPDPYEACYPGLGGNGGLDGTIGDAFADPDNDKVPNYLEYYSASVYHWQYDVWSGHPTTTPYDSGDFYGGTNGTPKVWDWSQLIYNPLQGGVGRFGYSGSAPNLVDSDDDGMDDYYEIYHGLNPAYGVLDLILSRIMEKPIEIGIFSPYIADPRTAPYVNGSPFMDSDGDGLPNSEEGVNLITPDLAPQYHTDPSPLWITDMAYGGSWVNLYYIPGSFWPWSGSDFPPIYAYDFESNEGFDTDNDGFSDREELVATQTDPLSPERPLKRRALYLPPGQDAYARTFPGYAFLDDQLRSFTVEAWVRPINPAAGTNQTVVERPLAIPVGNPMYLAGMVRVNLRLGLDPNGLPYVGYNGEGAEAIFYMAKAGTTSRISAGSWTHIAGTYQVPSATDPSQRGVLTLYVNGQLAAQTNPDELPSTARFGNGPTPFQFGAPIIIGASDANPKGDMDFTTFMIPSPEPFDFFKGWVDEVRIWNGARSQSQVISAMKLRMKLTDVQASFNTTVPMVYHYSFDNLPDPDHTPTAPAGLGFDITGNYIFPANYGGVGFWAAEPSRSMVYAGVGGGDPRYLPWIENTVGHMPKIPPVDIGDPNAVVSVTNGTIVTQSVPFRNTWDPYGHRHITYPAFTPESMYGFFLYDDLLPLGWAASDEDVPMWDGGGTPALDPFSSLGDGIPDAWKEQYGFDPFDTSVAAGDPDKDGLNNYYEYLCGTDPKAPISGSDNIPDGEQDADGDGLSNIQELQHGTMPNLKDTDDDGLTDWEEVSGRVDASWVRPATSPIPKVASDPLNPLSPAVQRSVYLNGSARLIVPPSDKLLSKNWTVESWVNPDANCTGGVIASRYVQGFSASEFAINYEIGLTTNGAPAGMLRPYARYMMMTNGSPRETRVDGLGATDVTNGLTALLIPTGTWTYVAGVCDSVSNVMALYINGKLATYRTDLIALPTTVYGYGTGHRDDEVTIGASRSTGAVSNGFKGYLDNVRIWSTNRTDAEILDRYNAPEGVPSSTVRLPLKSGPITMSGGLSAEASALTATTAARILVKFTDEATARDSATLSAAGVQVLNYVGQGVRAVKATSAQLALLGGKVTWTGVLKADNKISPLLNVGSGTNGSRQVLVNFFKDVAQADAVQAVQAVGGVVYNGKYIAGQDLVATLTDDQLTALAGNNAVAWIMPAASFLTSGRTVYRLSDHVVGGADLAPFVNRGNGWDGPGRGTAQLTYHFVNFNCNLPQATAKRAVSDQLFKWSQYADITFTESATAGLPYSMDIDWETIDGPSGILGMGYYPNDINPEPIAGDFLLDAEETWKDGMAGNGIDLQYVSLHEEGHCLGMAHSDDPAAIMYPYYDGTRDATLAPDDIAGIQNIYGAAPTRNGYAEFRFDDGGVSAQDFTVSNDWRTGWASAAKLDGAIFSTNKVAPLNKDTDGDGLPDWWEMANSLNPYDSTGQNGAYGDPDNDGLNNLGEYLAGTDPHQWSTAGNTFSDYDSRQGPGFRTYGELYDDGDYIPDLWEVNYPGPCATTGKRGLDPAYYDANLDPDEDGWNSYAEYLAGTDPLIATNYPLPMMSVHARYFGKLGNTLESAMAGSQGTNAASSSAVVVNFYHSAGMDGYADATLNMAYESILTNVMTSGHIHEGNNYVFGFLDVDGNGIWDPTKEPAGIAQFQPVNVSWGAVNNLELDLTDTMPGYPRFSWPAASNVTAYTVSCPLVTRTIQAPRNYFHEGDWLAAGLYGVTTGDVITPWSIYADGVAYTNVLMGSFPRASSLVASTIATPNGSMQFQYALNELEFTVDTNATAYRIQFAATSNAATPLLAYTNIVPYMDINGVRKIKVPFYAGDNFATSAASYASSVWNNGQYWVRVQGFTRGVNSSWSPWSSFMLNVQPPSVGGKSMITGDLYYFGKINRGYGVSQSSNLTLIVQAFQSSGFSGIPDGQVQVSYQCNTNAPSVKKGSYSLMGLRNEPYYVRAFIDVNGNRQLDSWEPFGFVQSLNSNGFYQVAAVDLSGGANTLKSDVRIVIRDRDTDDDALPDGWEWMYYGTLGNCSSNIGANSLTLLRNYEIEPADLDPTKTDYDADGVPDQVEIDWTDARAGVPANPAHTFVAVNWSNLTTRADHVYNPYDPVTSPAATDLNPTKWDTDGDGLSDGYEITHGLNPIDPTDGAAQIAKAKALGEAIPGVPAISQVAAVTPEIGQFSLTWQGQIGMSYEVQFSDDLKTWASAANGQRYGAATHTYVDQSPKVSTRFYRVVVK